MAENFLPTDIFSTTIDQSSVDQMWQMSVGQNVGRPSVFRQKDAEPLKSIFK